jgi:CRP-like cAMP-binding protein
MEACMPIKENLQNCDLFFELTIKEIEFLIRNCAVETFEKGVRVFNEGDTLDSIYIVLEGRCEIVKNLNTKIFELQKLKQWDHFGEGSFCGQELFIFDVVATEKLSLLKISFNDFHDFFNNFASASGVLMNNLFRLEKEKLMTSLGVILRLYGQENAEIGLPLLGQRRLSSEEIIALKKKKLLKKSA